MRKTAVLLLALLLSAGPAAAAQSGFGLGIIAGEPTGLSFKAWLGGNRAVDAAAAWSMDDNESFQLHADYLLHTRSVASAGAVGGSLPFYYGIGARVLFKDDGGHHGDDDTHVGVRIPLGLDWLPSSAPLDVFLEIVPVLDLVPGTDLDFNGAIGIRYWFR